MTPLQFVIASGEADFTFKAATRVALEKMPSQELAKSRMMFGTNC